MGAEFISQSLSYSHQDSLPESLPAQDRRAWLFPTGIAALMSATEKELHRMSAYYLLAIAICAEVIGTVSMKAVKGFSTPIPLVIVGYAIAFWMLTLVVRTIPVGVAYAVWAGMGIVMVSIAALFIYGQKLDLPAIAGMGLIVAGVVVIQLFSKTAGH
jgi:small multidrug resistance pump